jgi:small acid-soluble spore protein (thioredoxin-like protein)
MGMKSKPANRSNNVRSTKNNIDKTNSNIEFANEIIAETPDRQLKSELTEKNKRREQALEGLYQEVRDEAKHHKP